MHKSIHHFRSNKPGAILAVFCGVHGNERAGITAVEKFITDFKPERGEVFFVFANPPAIKKGVRMIEGNLNRCFNQENPGKTIEEKRAQVLMKILNKCDALLDLHGYNSEEDEPFAICEENALPVVKKLPVKTVLTGLESLEPGATNAYMHRRGKVGICLECGPNSRPMDYTDLATTAIKTLLEHFGVIAVSGKRTTENQRTFQAIKVVKKQTENFTFNKMYKNFDKLSPKTVFAADGQVRYVAPGNTYIIFPRANNPIGSEAFLLAALTPNKN